MKEDIENKTLLGRRRDGTGAGDYIPSEASPRAVDPSVDSCDNTAKNAAQIGTQKKYGAPLGGKPEVFPIAPGKTPEEQQQIIDRMSGNS